MPSAGHALWAEVGRGVTFATSGENAWQLITLSFSFFCSFLLLEAIYASLGGQPSLHGFDACMVYWTKGALRRNCRSTVRPLFLLFGFFLLSRNSRGRFLGSYLLAFVDW